jgi:tetratricopeptide (TPR) repeat protein
MKNAPKAELFFISGIAILFLHISCLLAQPAPQDMHLLTELARKYHGKHRVELTGGIVLKPDAVREKDGFVEMFFKGNAQGEDEFEQAIAYPLNKVKQIDNKKVDSLIANYQLANNYFYNRRDYIRAIRYYRKVLALKPPKEMARIAYENLGFCYNQPLFKNFTSSIELNLEALAKFPRDEKLWLHLGTAYLGAGDFKKAEECYYKVLYIKPDSPASGIAHANLASIYYQQGKRVEARFHLEQAREIFVKNKMQKYVEAITPLISKCTIEIKSE